MKKFILVVLAGFCMVLTACTDSSSDSPSQQGADLVVYADIFTAEEADAEAFAVKDGKYIYVGERKGAEKFVDNRHTKVIDRHGDGLVIPGCTEGHAHMILAEEWAKLSLTGGNLEEIKTKIIDWRKKHPNDKQLIAFGLDDYFMRIHPADINYAEELEKCAPQIPILLNDGSGHSMLANVTALKMAGLWKEKPTLRGGEFELDRNNYPTGFIFDQAVPYMMQKALLVPSLDDEAVKKACQAGVEELNRRGYTNYLDGWLNFLHDSTEYRFLHDMELTAYVAASYNIQSYDAQKYKEKVEHVSDFVKKFGNAHFNPAYIKLFVDGVTESMTGWLFTRYDDPIDPARPFGTQIWTQEELNHITSYANDRGITIHAHTYGDAACNAMINSHISSDSKMRNIIAHARNVTAADMERIAKNGNMGVAENMIWHRASEEYIKGLEQVVPKGYVEGYPMKSFVEKGVRICSSTDAPASEEIKGNIINVLYVSVAGKHPEIPKEAAFFPHELLSVRQALKALTIDGAWTLGIEHERGSVKVGKYADCVILDKNVLTCPVDEIKDSHVERTYFEGKCVYPKEIE